MRSKEAWDIDRESVTIEHATMTSVPSRGIASDGLRNRLGPDEGSCSDDADPVRSSVVKNDDGAPMGPTRPSPAVEYAAELVLPYVAFVPPAQVATHRRQRECSLAPST